MIKMTSLRARSAFPGWEGMLRHMVEPVPSEHLFKGDTPSPSSRGQRAGRAAAQPVIPGGESFLHRQQLVRVSLCTPRVLLEKHRAEVFCSSKVGFTIRLHPGLTLERVPSPGRAGPCCAWFRTGAWGSICSAQRQQIRQSRKGSGLPARRSLSQAASETEFRCFTRTFSVVPGSSRYK